MAGRKWTEDEEELLTELVGMWPMHTIAKRLCRTIPSVALKINRMGLGSFFDNSDMIAAYVVENMLGLSQKTIKRVWVNKGLNVVRKKPYTMIKQSDLIRFLRENPDLWSAADVKDDTLLRGFDWYRKKRFSDKPKKFYWTAAELSRLKSYAGQQRSIAEIAHLLNKSENAIYCQMYRMRKQGIRI